MLIKTILKVCCLTICLAVITQSFFAQSIPGRQGFYAQLKGKTDAEAWDIVNAQKNNLGNYINAQDAYFMVFNKKYPSTRPAGRGTPAPAAGAKKPEELALNELTTDDMGAWLAQANSGIINASAPSIATNNLDAVIDAFKKQGYKQNDNYKVTLAALNQLKDKIQSFITLPALPEIPVERPKSITGKVQDALNNAIKALANAIKAAPDATTVDYMIQQFNKGMNYYKKEKQGGESFKPLMASE